MKLEGLRVIDLGLYLPTPVITQMMADHGANVVSVEPPSGDPARYLARKSDEDEQFWFDAMHRGKRSLVADLKEDEGRDLVLKLASEADVVIESFRPGVAKRLGIGADVLCAANARLIYCSLSAFGQTGPLSSLPGHDLAVQAYAGFVSLNGRPGELPVVPGAPSADMVGGMSALSAIMMALYRREQTGRGDVIDISMYDSLLAWTPHFQTFATLFGQNGQDRLQAAISGSAFYNIYSTRDGKSLALAGLEPHYIRNFLDAVARTDLLEDAVQDPGPSQDRVIEELRKLFVTRTYDDWCALLSTLNVSWAPVIDMADAFRQPHSLSRQIISVGVDATSPATPLKFAREPAENGRPAPALDQHGKEIAERGFASSAHEPQEG